MGKGCTEKCRYKCHEKIKEEERKQIFNSYWSLGSHERQWDFIGINVKFFKKRQLTVDAIVSRRDYSRKYTFIVDNEEVQVCKQMFTQTLSISDRVVTTVFKKLEKSHVISADARGKHNNRPNKIPEEVKKYIRMHILQFPVIESHYTRENSQRQYLQPDLSIAKMHRLYLQWIQDKIVSEPTQNATLRQYTDIFNDFNYSFFKPKKDMCDICEKYKLATPEEKNLQQLMYDEHQNNKIIAREKKKLDKLRANHDPAFCVAAFDLEKILVTPQGEVSNFFYKRKFAVYNFTVYDIGKKIGYCFMWDESQAKRGANEIATCLFMFLKIMVAKGVKEFSFYSDNCGGQNRNRFLFSMWEYASFTLKIEITHRFLEKGHTQNEGDSMHATIENAKKGKSIYVPEDWIALVTSAKINGEPYRVQTVRSEEFLNFKPLVENDNMNWKIQTNKDKVLWSQIKELSTSYRNPFQFEIKYKLNCTDTFNVSLLKTKNKGRFQPRVEPAQAYLEKLRIDKAKLADLLSLCQMGLIPTEHHGFYKSLVAK